MKEWGTGSFGSTSNPEIYRAMDITRGKPDKQVTLTHPNGNSITKRLTIDTNQSSTIWPKNWPVVNPVLGIAGIGGTQASRLSREAITFTFPDGVNVTRPYVMQTPRNLLGLIARDMLSQLKVTIVT